MRKQFPLLEQCVYLNTAYTAPLSTALMQWREADEKKYFELGDQYKIINEKNYYAIAQRELAKFLTANPENIHITGNFSTAFQNFIVQLPADFHFLLLEEEYPSLKACIRDEGFSFDEIPIATTIEETVWAALKTAKYDVLALSAIQYTSGIFFDFDALNKMKQAFPELLILVDGTQFVGAEEFDFSASAVDAIFGSTYKWLMAGHGTGYAVIQPHLANRLKIDDDQFHKTYDRGQLSIKAVGSLAHALKSLNEMDFKALIAQKNKLTSTLKVELEKRKLLDETVVNRHQHSSIFNLNLSGEIYKELLDQNVRCMRRGSGVRIALHVYNNLKDIERFLKILDRLI